MGTTLKKKKKEANSEITKIAKQNEGHVEQNLSNKNQERGPLV
jgi:hypothetical protein